jgi:hypothetical protein
MTEITAKYPTSINMRSMRRCFVGVENRMFAFIQPTKQRRIDRILIDVGYFAVISVIFILFALI